MTRIIMLAVCLAISAAALIGITAELLVVDDCRSSSVVLGDALRLAGCGQ